jgi:hypothetical protein
MDQENTILVEDETYYLTEIIISEGIPYEVYVNDNDKAIYVVIN